MHLNSKCWWGYRTAGVIHYGWWECMLVQILCKPIWPYMVRLENPTPEIFAHKYKKHMQIHFQKRTVNFQQPKYSSVVEQINKCWYSPKLKHCKMVEVSELHTQRPGWILRTWCWPPKKEITAWLWFHFYLEIDWAIIINCWKDNC